MSVEIPLLIPFLFFSVLVCVLAVLVSNRLWERFVTPFVMRRVARRLDISYEEVRRRWPKG